MKRQDFKKICTDYKTNPFEIYIGLVLVGLFGASIYYMPEICSFILFVGGH